MKKLGERVTTVVSILFLIFCVSVIAQFIVMGQQWDQKDHAVQMMQGKGYAHVQVIDGTEDGIFLFRTIEPCPWPSAARYNGTAESATRFVKFYSCTLHPFRDPVIIVTRDIEKNW